MAAPLDDFAMCSCALTRHPTFTLHELQRARHVGMMRNAFRQTALCIWFELQKGPIVMLKMLYCPHLTGARPFSWDADRPDRGRQIVPSLPCPPCALLQAHVRSQPPPPRSRRRQCRPPTSLSVVLIAITACFAEKNITWVLCYRPLWF